MISKKSVSLAVATILSIGLICSVVEANDTSNENNNNNNGYQGESGQKYQYDLSNSSDRIDYSTDIDAQRRDTYNYDNSANQNKQYDKSMGQNGGGIYNGN